MNAPQKFAGAHYVDAQNGHKVAVWPNKVVVDGREFTFPFGDTLLRQPRISFSGKVVGISSTDLAYELVPGGNWTENGVAFGPNSVGYLVDELRTITGPPAVGIRYFTPQGVLVNCEDTNRDLARSIWEFTDLGDVSIGQGGNGPLGEDPAVIWLDGKRYLIEAGQCRFIRAYRDGDNFTVAFVNQTGWGKDPLGGRIYEFTRDEITSVFKEIKATPPPPPPPPDPIEEEPVEPEKYKFDEEIQSIINELYERNKDLAHSKEDSDRQRLQEKIVQTIVARKPDEKFGWKSNHGINIANSKDAFCQLLEETFKPDERQLMAIWDCFNGDTRLPNQFPLCEFSKQFFVPVEPIDHLKKEEPVDEPEEPVDEPGEPVEEPVLDLNEIVASITAKVIEALKVELAPLMAQLDRGFVGQSQKLPLVGTITFDIKPKK